MAGPKKTRGFTLVELLVVITIIGMLVSLLLPAIQSAREAGRKNTCQSNMRNNAIALLQFENNKKGFPGYANVLGSGLNARRASWVVPILPLLERNDIYQWWQNTNVAPTAANLPNFATQMGVLVCPSNPNPGSNSNPLSFVVNTGFAVTANDNAPDPMDNTKPVGSPYPSAGVWDDFNSGVFFNQSRWDGHAGPAYGSVGAKKSTLDFISTNDGTTYTLMLSENLQATTWATEGTDPAAQLCPYQTDFSLRQSTGFVWYPTGLADNRGPAAAGTFNLQAIVINGLAKQFTGTPTLAYNSSPSVTNPTGLAFARPSSNHPGGVNAAFCGGNMRFIAEDIGYNVYTQLMTPNQFAVGLQSGVNPATPKSSGWVYLLNEADY